METIHVEYYDSPCGKMVLGSYHDHLCLCDWATEYRRNSVGKRIEHLLHSSFTFTESKIITQARYQLDEYFAGNKKKFTLPLLMLGTDFQKQVWRALLNVPYGKTYTYRQLAMQINRPTAFRAVANANSANALSIFIPCHRIIGSHPQSGGYAGGMAAKVLLLDLEKKH